MKINWCTVTTKYIAMWNNELPVDNVLSLSDSSVPFIDEDITIII
jgi:hypothetical protein